MEDSIYDVDNLLDITDEEIGGFIGGSNHGSLNIPFQVGCMFSLDNFYDIDWIPDLMQESLVNEKPKLQTSSDLGTAKEEEHGPKNDSEVVISSSLTSESDGRSWFGKMHILGSGKFIPGKPRSKRSRKPVSNWGFREINSLFPNASSGTGNGTNSSIPSDASGCITSDYFQSSMKFTIAKQGIKKMEEDPNQVRRCKHCGANNTPQWRCGPLGPKTLCNACGVRYKSGRLFPEYRPAASPTFSAYKHSNSHKTVMEMRRQKEIVFSQT